MPLSAPVSASFERDVAAELRRHAQRTGRPVAAVVREAVEHYLNERLDASTAPATPLATAGAAA